MGDGFKRKPKAGMSYPASASDTLYITRC